MQIAALQLVDRGLLSLDMDVGTVLAGLKEPRILKGYSEEKPVFELAKTKVTLAMLLNHTSGLSLGWFSAGEFQISYPALTTR